MIVLSMRYNTNKITSRTNMGKTIFDFTIKDYKNENVSLRKFENNKVVLIVNVASF